jgi:hypothetical protein
MLVTWKQWSLVIGLTLGGSLLGALPSPGEELPPRPCRQNADCGFLEFCQKRWGDCDGKGKCQNERGLSTADLRIVCGCDGQTYDHPAMAASLGVNVDYEGKCSSQK